MSPIYVRPEREQAEHDRQIRFLQAEYSRKLEAVANPGDERVAAIKVGTATHFPDLVLNDGNRLAGVVEIETAASVNNLETMAKWVPFCKARVPFHLYVPVQGYEAAMRLAHAHQVKAAEVWTYRPASEGFDLVRMFVDPSIQIKSAKGSAARAVAKPVPVVPVPVPAPTPAPAPAPASSSKAVVATPAAVNGAAKPAKPAAQPAPAAPPATKTASAPKAAPVKAAASTTATPVAKPIAKVAASAAAKPVPKAVVKPVVKAPAKSVAKPVAKPAAKPTPKVKAKVEPKAKAKPKAKPVAKATKRPAPVTRAAKPARSVSARPVTKGAKKGSGAKKRR